MSITWSNDVSSQQSVCLLVSQDLDHAICVIVALGSAVGCEGELAHCELHSLRLQILFILT